MIGNPCQRPAGRERGTHTVNGYLGAARRTIYFLRQISGYITAHSTREYRDLVVRCRLYPFNDRPHAIFQWLQELSGLVVAGTWICGSNHFRIVVGISVAGRAGPPANRAR